MKAQKKPIKNLLKPIEKGFNQSQSTLVVNNTKKNLTILDASQTINVKPLTTKMVSPKQALYKQNSVLSPTNKLSLNSFNNSKHQIKNNLNFKKNNQEKAGLVKKQKTESISGYLSSNKDKKIATSQYLISQNQTESNNQQNVSLNVDLQTSILKQSEEQCGQNISNFIQSQCMISQLKQESKKKEQQIVNLKKQNQSLQRKLQKIRASQEQSRKMLKSKITSFNEEGEELKSLKQKLAELQSLKKEKNSIKPLKLQTKLFEIQVETTNQIKLDQVSQASIEPFFVKQQSNKQMGDPNVVTCSQDQGFSEVLSSLNNQSGHSLSQESKKEDNWPSLSLQIQKIKIKYSQLYSQKVQNLKQIYDQNLTDVQKRYNLMIEQTKQATRQQATQIFTLQKQLDSLYQKVQGQSQTSSIFQYGSPALNLLDKNQQSLKHFIEINKYRKIIQQNGQQLKQSKQKYQLCLIQCKAIKAELDIQRMKSNLTRQRNKNKIQLIKQQHLQEMELVKQQLKREKQINQKLKAGYQQKEQLIKKMTAINNKKYAGRK